MLVTDHLPVRVPLALVGWLLVGTGVAVLLKSGWGVAPYDVFSSGLAHATGLAVGTASWIAAGSCVAVAFLLGKRPGWGTLVGAFVVGLVINLCLSALPDLGATLPLSVPSALIGLTLLLVGASLTIVAGLGAGGIELLMLALADLRWGTRAPLGVARARWLLEALLCLSGWILGGAVGMMTLVAVVVSGPAFAHLLPLLHSLFRLPHPADLDDGDLAGR